MKGLDDRNLTSHTYNETIAETVVSLVTDQYIFLFQELLISMRALVK